MSTAGRFLTVSEAAREPGVGAVRGLAALPLTRDQANAFVMLVHRHHGRVTGHRFIVGAELDGALVGVAVAGRPRAKAKFNPYSGFGVNGAERWQLTEEARKALKLGAFGPRARPRARPLKRGPKAHPKQLPLIGTGAVKP